MQTRWIAAALAVAASSPAMAQDAGAAASKDAPPANQTPAQHAKPAQPPGSDEAAKKKLEEEIAKELGVKAGSAAPLEPSAPGAGNAAAGAAPAAGGTTGGGGPYARLLLMPDISAVGDFAAAYDSYDVPRLSPRNDLFGPPDQPKPLFQELELGLQSVVDPYARADVFIAFHPDGVDVEEAYLTTLTLPAGLQVRAGKFFAPFGRLDQQHPHVWDFVDAPLGMSRVLAGDVLSGPGVDVAWLAPVPWFAELHVAGQGTAPATAYDVAARPATAADERLTGIVRLLQYAQAGDATTVGVGLSAATRAEGGGAFRDLGGADLFVKIRPPRGRAYLALQGELFARRYRGEPGPSDWGTYAQAFLRTNPYYGFGVRWDRAPAAGDAPPGPEQRVSGVATWFLSEFQRVRLQASWDRLPGGRDGLEALLHLEFAIGAHGAHPF